MENQPINSIGPPEKLAELLPMCKVCGMAWYGMACGIILFFRGSFFVKRF